MAATNHSCLCGRCGFHVVFFSFQADCVVHFGIIFTGASSHIFEVAFPGFSWFLGARQSLALISTFSGVVVCLFRSRDILRLTSSVKRKLCLRYQRGKSEKQMEISCGRSLHCRNPTRSTLAVAEAGGWWTTKAFSSAAFGSYQSNTAYLWKSN